MKVVRAGPASRSCRVSDATEARDSVFGADKECPNSVKYTYPDTRMARLMDKYQCNVCGYIYDESKEGVPFEELPEDWTCPECGVGKEEFSKM